jgi:DNA-binding MarR family transcriptional regulator
VTSRLDQQIAAVRRFNRFYTRQIGVLQKGLLESDYSLAEVRILYELAQRKECAAVELQRELGLDAGYLSRIIRSFQRRRLISRRVSKADGRQSILSLTAKGQEVFAELNTRANDEIATRLRSRSAEDQRRLTEAMRTIEEILAKDESS